jgi:hypothetical protein
MLEPEDYDCAAHKAACHLQMIVREVGRLPGEAVLTGTVVKVFRGPATLRGADFSLRVGCFQPGVDADWPPDGTPRFLQSALRAGRVLEAFVELSPEGPVVASGLCTLIDAATDRPVLT